jgi:cytoskeletal protein CcmA (bactofilin family)
MWKKDEPKSQGVPDGPSPVAGTSQSSMTSAPSNASASVPVSSKAVACISQGIRIKGEVIGKEDLFVDGTVEGKLDLVNSSCTIGPNGKVTADVTAREVIVRGQVDGKIDGRERVQLWNSGRVNGEVRTERLAIEDGAVLRGKVEAGKLREVGSQLHSTGAAAGAGEKSKGGSVDSSSRAAVI